jgi:hypothetical protein
MVVNTRSRSCRNRQIEAAAAAATAAAADSCSGGRDRRRVRIQTPSFRDASIRTYKIYTGGISRRRDEAAAAEALIEMSEPDYHDVIESDAATATVARINHMCINPMRPITQYMYQIVVYNYDRTLHHKSAFILYNKATRMYYIYSIISNGHAYYHGGSCEFDASATTTTTTVDPVNTIQTKFSSYTTETITEYVMTLLVPSFGHAYYIQDQIIGVVSTVSDNDATYYEIDQLLYEKTSSETTNGLNAFPLIPYREYWADSRFPSESMYQYTEDTLHSALQILGQSV